MKKGDLVKLNPADPDIERLLGWDKKPVNYMASRPTTNAERQAWRDEKQKALQEAADAGEDTFSIAFNDAGESRLPPRSISVALPIDRIYVVERARCRVQLGWGNATGGMTRVLDTQTGQHAYVRREMLEVIK